MFKVRRKGADDDQVKGAMPHDLVGDMDATALAYLVSGGTIEDSPCHVTIARSEMDGEHGQGNRVGQALSRRPSLRSPASRNVPSRLAVSELDSEAQRPLPGTVS